MSIKERFDGMEEVEEEEEEVVDRQDRPRPPYRTHLHPSLFCFSFRPADLHFPECMEICCSMHMYGIIEKIINCWIIHPIPYVLFAQPATMYHEYFFVILAQPRSNIRR